MTAPIPMIFLLALDLEESDSADEAGKELSESDDWKFGG